MASGLALLKSVAMSQMYVTHTIGSLINNVRFFVIPEGLNRESRFEVCASGFPDQVGE